MLISIKEIYQQAEKLSQLEQIKVGGWVKSIRQNKFIELNDGSCLSNLQLVCPPNLVEKVKQINFGSSLVVNGRLMLTPERTQICELQVQTIVFFNPGSFEYHEPNNLPWINSGVLTNLYFLTEYTPPSKLISEEAFRECKIPPAQPHAVLISDIDLDPSKIVWVMKNSTQGTHVWQLLGTDVWQLLGTDVYKNSTLFFALRKKNFKQYASGSIINHLRGSELMKLEIDWIINKPAQARLFLLLNSPLAKIKDLHTQIKDLHTQIKDLLLLKYFSD